MKLERVLNVIFSKNSSGNPSPRISLPLKWLSEMGITPENRQTVLTFDGETITIKKGE